MRVGTALAAAQMLATVANAEALPERMVAVLDKVCVTPASSEAKMAAAESGAAMEHWKLIKAGPGPMPLLHNESGVGNSYQSAWKLDLPGASQANLFLSIIRPEQPGLRHTVCVIQPDVDVDREEFVRSIDRQWGARLSKDISSRFKDQESWFFADERSKGNCGKQLTVFLHQTSERGKPKTLMFTDFAYPDDGQWTGLAKATLCPN